MKAAVTIPIFVNGGLDTPVKIRNVFDDTGCDGVMIARAAINNPWIFRDAKHFLQTGDLLPVPLIDERVRVLIEHLNLSIELKGERKAVIEFRKHYSGYLRNLPNASKIRNELMQFVELSPIVDHILQYVAWLKSAELVGVAV